MKAGGLKFNRKGQLLNSRRTSQEGIDFEVDAYQVGYSYDGQYPLPASSLKEINHDSLKEIKREDGTSVYDDLYKDLNK